MLRQPVEASGRWAIPWLAGQPVLQVLPIGLRLLKVIKHPLPSPWMPWVGPTGPGYPGYHGHLGIMDPGVHGMGTHGHGPGPTGMGGAVRGMGLAAPGCPGLGPWDGAGSLVLTPGFPWYLAVLRVPGYLYRGIWVSWHPMGYLGYLGHPWIPDPWAPYLPMAAALGPSPFFFHSVLVT